MKNFYEIKYDIPKEIIDFLNATFLIYEKRALIGETKNIIFEVRTKEQGHNRAHIHACYNHKYSVSISIDDKIEIISGNIPDKQKNIAIKWVKENINEIRTKWNNYHKELELYLVGSALDFETINV